MSVLQHMKKRLQFQCDSFTKIALSSYCPTAIIPRFCLLSNIRVALPSWWRLLELYAAVVCRRLQTLLRAGEVHQILCIFGWKKGFSCFYLQIILLKGHWNWSSIQIIQTELSMMKIISVYKWLYTPFIAFKASSLTPEMVEFFVKHTII